MDRPFALLIEDDRDVATLFRHVLDMADYRSEIVYDGIEAMKRLADNQPDVVLLDLQLPGISGVEILQKMRADEQLKTVPVIVITAYANYARNLPIKPDLFLLKPVDIHDLSNLIQRLRDKNAPVREPPYDNITHLYSESFFSMRLLFAMERVKHMDVERFAILFADLHPFQSLQDNFSEDVRNAFLRKLADQFKNLLHPSDTLAWSKDGCLLSLCEEIPVNFLPGILARQVGIGLNDFLKRHELQEGLRIQTGIILCDDEYKGVQEVLEDIKFARAFVKSQPDAGHWVYSRNDLRQMRSSHDS